MEALTLSHTSDTIFLKQKLNELSMIWTTTKQFVYPRACCLYLTTLFFCSFAHGTGLGGMNTNNILNGNMLFLCDVAALTSLAASKGGGKSFWRVCKKNR